nr:maleylpyruvate isomerase family mycothiol-dependent enzyme [Modestobacter muralis]
MDRVPAELFDTWTAAVEREGERFGVVAQELDAGRTPAAGGLQAAVPWLTDWTARDLVSHLGVVHRWVVGILRAGTTQRPRSPRDLAPPDEDLHGWYAQGLIELVATLRTTDPDAPAWHMSPAAAQTAGSWARRQAHEHTVHRHDLEAAASLAHAPVDPVLAGDGVDELLAVVLPRWQHTAPLATGRARVGVVATDLARSWTVEVADGAVRCTDGPAADPDAEVAGTATQLLLHLWGRPGEVAVHGDRSAEALLRGR